MSLKIEIESKSTERSITEVPIEKRSSQLKCNAWVEFKLKQLMWLGFLFSLLVRLRFYVPYIVMLY